MCRALLLLGFPPAMSSPGLSHGARRQRSPGLCPHHPPTAWLLPRHPLPSPVASAGTTAGPSFPVDHHRSCEGISKEGWWDLMLTSLRSREGAAAASALPIARTSAREVMLSAPFQHPGPGQAVTGWTWIPREWEPWPAENSLTLYVLFRVM